MGRQGLRFLEPAMFVVSVQDFLDPCLNILGPRCWSKHWLIKSRRIDFLDAFILVLAVISLLTGLNLGSNIGRSNPNTVIPLSLTHRGQGRFAPFSPGTHHLPPGPVRGALRQFL
ncbi:hypothetical protein MGU_01985 [Metarhizium guizhouense ARSEF 977]|uniref:Uncharacterized protein n=1 Tax=Metarhizium guizhouense (strain ARSEF 977) TaxID=1276136 RepID=A0A0B4HM40_METGA|nr:hypothetical protein MGU_01985 [Metarhizium guizhouense ARSEF 977]